MINDQTQLNLVIGYPLAHSKSPILHNAIYQSLNVNAVMLAHRSPILKDIVQAIKTLSIGLTAVTMPYKEAIIPYLDELSHEALALKAVNTIIQKQGKLTGYNTDVDGVAYALHLTPLKNRFMLVIGAGGAARALGYYLQQQEAKIYWFNRTKTHAESLMNDFGGQVIDGDEVKQIAFDLIINTTPLGSSLHQDITPLPDFTFHAEQTVFDMVYYPKMTRLLDEASRAGASTISGLTMFLGQGIKQEEYWLNQPIKSAKLIDDLTPLLEE